MNAWLAQFVAHLVMLLTSPQAQPKRSTRESASSSSLQLDCKSRACKNRRGENQEREPGRPPAAAPGGICELWVAPAGLGVLLEQKHFCAWRNVFLGMALVSFSGALCLLLLSEFGLCAPWHGDGSARHQLPP